MEAANSADTNMAIFEQICEIVVDPKFIEAQNTFLESNMSIFDEKADENKLSTPQFSHHTSTSSTN